VAAGLPSLSFLLGALSDGPVLVTELEAAARAVGLLREGRRIADTRVFKEAKKALGLQSRRDGFGLGERQSITVSKKFRAAKKKLGIISRRDGFGRGGEWF
jgi:hypothetical protein